MKKKLHFLIVGLVVFFAVSCEKNNLRPDERRLIGAWKFDKVSVVEKGSVLSKEVTVDYATFEFVFKEDFTTTYGSAHTGENYTGVWEIERTNRDDTSEKSLILSYSNDDTGEVLQFIFGNLYLTNNRLKGRNIDNNRDFYRYNLTR